MLTAFVLALSLAPAADVAVITPNQAKDHVDQEVVVQGQVTQIGASERSLTGRVQVYKGKPEIILERGDQVTAVGDQVAMEPNHRTKLTKPGQLRSASPCSPPCGGGV